MFRATAGTAGVNIATVVAGSVGGLVLARALGPTHRGELVTILLWPIAIGSLASFGIAQSTVYWVSRSHTKSIPIISTAVAGSLIAGLLIAALGPWIADLIARNQEVRLDLALVLALTPFYITGGVWAAALQATSIARWNVMRCLQPIIYLAAVLILWGLGRLSLSTVVAAFAISLISQTLYAAIAVRRTVGPHSRPHANLLAPLYSYGSKVWLASVPQLVNVNVDQLILSVMPTIVAAQLGNYTVAVSLSWLALPAATAFGSVAFPRIARMAGADTILRMERDSLIGAGVTAAITVGLICALAPAVVTALFGRGYQDAIFALWLLAPGAVFLALNRVLGDVLQGRGRPLIRSASEALGAALTLVLLFVLIPPYGIRGAAITSSVTYAAVFVILLLGLKRARSSATLTVEG
jgi:O-antigen/teichoic acid export membrane protein